MILNVCQVEFHEGSNTIWVHSPDGSTMLRIKCTGRIIVDHSQTCLVAHGDMIVPGDIHICVPAKTKKKGQAQ